jgi:hypothetical protein
MNPYYGRMPSAETIYAIPQQIKNIYDRAWVDTSRPSTFNHAYLESNKKWPTSKTSQENFNQMYTAVSQIAKDYWDSLKWYKIASDDFSIANKQYKSVKPKRNNMFKRIGNYIKNPWI